MKSVEGVALAFEPSYFDHLVQSSEGKHSQTILHSLAACPPKIDHLMRALMYESNDASTEEGIGLECIATAIALAICQHTRSLPSTMKAGPRLAPRQIRAVQSYVEDNLNRHITLADLSNIAELSAFHFLRSFKGSLGITPAKYVLDCRVERARSLLRSSHLTISEIAIRVGFEDLSHFSRAFRRVVGVPPSTFRNELQQ